MKLYPMKVPMTSNIFSITSFFEMNLNMQVSYAQIHPKVTFL